MIRSLKKSWHLKNVKISQVHSVNSNSKHSHHTYNKIVQNTIQISFEQSIFLFPILIIKKNNQNDIILDLTKN
jgi:hypothetical protein